MPGTALTALQRKTLIALLGAGVFLASVASQAASATGKKLPPRPAPAKKPAATSLTPKKPAVKSGKRPASRRVSSKSRRSRPQSFRYRLARLKLQPDRITEIQTALVRAGYLNQEPNGKWDQATRASMLRFQQDHGFSSTGLPEAKSLMKLGLGPHPLPEELDPATQASSAGSPLSDPATANPANMDATGTAGPQ